MIKLEIILLSSGILKIKKETVEFDALFDKKSLKLHGYDRYKHLKARQLP